MLKRVKLLLWIYQNEDITLLDINIGWAYTKNMFPYPRFTKIEGTGTLFHTKFYTTFSVLSFLNMFFNSHTAAIASMISAAGWA